MQASMEITLRIGKKMAAAYLTTISCKPYIAHNLTTLIKTYKNYVQLSNLAYTMSLAQGQISHKYGFPCNCFRALRIVGKCTSRYRLWGLKNLFVLFCFSSKQPWRGNAATVRFHIKPWAASRTVQLVHSKNKCWMSATQKVKCTKATGSIGRTGIITCQRLLADVRRLSRLKATLCSACSSTVGVGKHPRGREKIPHKKNGGCPSKILKRIP